MCKTEADTAEQQFSSLNEDIANAVFRFLVGQDEEDAEQEILDATDDRKQESQRGCSGLQLPLGDFSAKRVDYRGQESEGACSGLVLPPGDFSANVVRSVLAPPPGDFSQAQGQQPREASMQSSVCKLQLSDVLLPTKEPMSSSSSQQYGFADPDLQRGQILLETLQAGFEELQMPCTLSSWQLAYFDQALSLSIRQLFAANLMPSLARVRECLRVKGIPEDQLKHLLKICTKLSPRYCFWVPLKGPICIVVVEEQQHIAIHPDTKEQFEEEFAAAVAKTFSEKFG